MKLLVPSFVINCLVTMFFLCSISADQHLFQLVNLVTARFLLHTFFFSFLSLLNWWEFSLAALSLSARLTTPCSNCIPPHSVSLDKSICRVNECKYIILNVTAAVNSHTYTCMHMMNLLGCSQSVQRISHSLDLPRDQAVVLLLRTT